VPIIPAKQNGVLPAARCEDDRSPTYNLLMGVHRELIELRCKVDEIRGQRGDKTIAQAAPQQAIR